MVSNRIQFRHCLSLIEDISLYGAHVQCAAALEHWRWPEGFVCLRCQGHDHYRVRHEGRSSLCQYRSCRHRCSLTARTLVDSSKLPLRLRFLAIYLISEAKTGLSALALNRQLGVSYRIAWLLNHKVMLAMAERDAQFPLCGQILVDDAYLGGERPQLPGQAVRGSPNKPPMVATVSLNAVVHPVYAKLSPLPDFAAEAVTDWATKKLRPGSSVLSDGLACIAGCAHSYVVVGGRKPAQMPEFRWVNTVLANLKTAIGGAHKAFKFGKYAHQYLGAFSYRFNWRFDLFALVSKWLRTAACAAPRTQSQIS